MEIFEIKEEHLILLQKMDVDTDEDFDRSPRINWKRPYGNGNYLDDVCEILGWEPDGDGFVSEYSEEQIDLAKKIHEETADVLQICLLRQEFKTGQFVKTAIFNNRSWKKVVNGMISISDEDV